MAAISVKSACGFYLGFLGSDVIASFSALLKAQKVFPLMIHRFKKIYYDTTQQVGLVNYFLDIMVPLG